MKYVLVIVFCFYHCVSFCQTQATVGVGLFLPEVAMLSISPTNTNINLSFSPPSQAGQRVQNNQSDNSKWLNFTSAVTVGKNRRIMAQVTSGNLSTGYSLVLETTKIGGTGNLGSAVPSIELSSSSQNIVAGIGGAFTGTGSNGYNLRYSLRIKDYSLLKVENNAYYSITFTLTDN